MRKGEDVERGGEDVKEEVEKGKRSEEFVKRKRGGRCYLIGVV